MQTGPYRLHIVRSAINCLTRAWPAKSAQSQLTAAIATISFDDFPQSAWSQAGPILEQTGICATYFVSGSLCGREIKGIQYFDQDDLVAVHAAGHEIGCHTFDHQPASEMSLEALKASLDRNATFVQAILGNVIMTSFAFPYGAATIPAKKLLSRRFAAVRGVRPGLNTGSIDLSQLKAYGLQANIVSKYPLETVVAEAKRKKACLNFFTHDVSDTPSYWGCTPEQLKQLIAILREAQIEILPIKNAIKRISYPSGCIFPNLSQKMFGPEV